MKIDKKITSLAELEDGLKKLFKKNKLTVLCLFSIAGSSKGLSLISISSEDFKEKLFVARLTEAMSKIIELEKEMKKDLSDVAIHFYDDIITCYPITDKIILASMGEKTKEILKFCKKYSYFISTLVK